MKGTKTFLIAGGSCLFLIIFLGMIYFGYRTFYIEKEAVEQHEYDYHFVLISEELDNDYWRLVEQGAKKAALEHNVFVEYVGPPKADNDQLLKLLDRMISMKVDGIITQGVEGEAFVDLVFKGVENRIPIMTIDTDVKSSVRKAYVGTNNFHAGQLAGKAMIEKTEGEQYVGIITGRFDAINQQERIAGFKDAIQTVDRIHVVGVQESNITETGAAQATYALLKEHPSITALVGMSALDGAGIVEGLHEFSPNKEVYVSAFDVLYETMKLIQDGEIEATIAQYPTEMGYQAMLTMLELQRHDVLETEIFIPTKIIEKENLNVFSQEE